MTSGKFDLRLRSIKIAPEILASIPIIGHVLTSVADTNETGFKEKITGISSHEI